VRQRPLAELSMDAEAPELALFRGRYQDEFRTAFTEALASLDRRERTLLRLHFLKRLTVDELAPMYQVHRATAARWVLRAQERLVEETQALFLGRVPMSEESMEQIVIALRGQLSIDLASILPAVGEPEAAD